MTTRASRRARREQQRDIERIGKNLEYRTKRGWLVQLAAITRSWALVQLTARFVRIEARAPGLPWVTLDVRPQIGPDGRVSLVSLRGQS